MGRARLKKSGAGKNGNNDGPAKVGQIWPPFAAQAFLDSADVSKTIVEYGGSVTIFAQGDSCNTVMYIQAGVVRLSVLSNAGKEATVAISGPRRLSG